MLFANTDQAVGMVAMCLIILLLVGPWVLVWIATQNRKQPPKDVFIITDPQLPPQPAPQRKNVVIVQETTVFVQRKTGGNS